MHWHITKMNRSKRRERERGEGACTMAIHTQYTSRRTLLSNQYLNCWSDFHIIHLYLISKIPKMPIDTGWYLDFLHFFFTLWLSSTYIYMYSDIRCFGVKIYQWNGYCMQKIAKFKIRTSVYDKQCELEWKCYYAWKKTREFRESWKKEFQILWQLIFRWVWKKNIFFVLRGILFTHILKIAMTLLSGTRYVFFLLSSKKQMNVIQNRK